MNDELRRELLAMREKDLRVRAEVIQGSSSFGGYHPRMEELHKRNTARLKQIIAEHGWRRRCCSGVVHRAAFHQRSALPTQRFGTSTRSATKRRSLGYCSGVS